MSEGYFVFKDLLQTLGFQKKKPLHPPKEIIDPRTGIGDVTDADFTSQVIESDLPVVVDVWAEWCQPCQVMSAYVTMLAQEYEGRVRVVALDADENPQTTDRYNIMGLPTLLLIRNGVEAQRIVGVTGYETVKEAVDLLLE